jgi:hypothetical protein
MGEVPIGMWGLRSTATWATAPPARAARRHLTGGWDPIPPRAARRPGAPPSAITAHDTAPTYSQAAHWRARVRSHPRALPHELFHHTTRKKAHR